MNYDVSTVGNIHTVKLQINIDERIHIEKLILIYGNMKIATMAKYFNPNKVHIQYCLFPYGQK